jgi:hypothetical protein
LSLSTNESATCRYGTILGVAYSSMTDFTTTGGTTHSKIITGLSNGKSFTYYVRCRDSIGNVNTDDFTISFSVGSTTSTADTTAPSQITNLSASNLTQNSIALSWKAPGDDGSTGTATSYDIRYSAAAITSSNFASATQVTGEPTPLSSGTSQSFTVTGLITNTTYYFAIKATDNANNVSTLSNVASGKPVASTGECFGAEACNPTGSPIGGGAGYSKIVTSGNYSVTTKAALLSALSSAQSGQTIFIPSGVTIDMNGSSFTGVKAGITIASNRGQNGAKGALIKMTTPGDSWETPIFDVKGNNVRFTGLQLEGEMYPQDYGNNSEYYPGSISEGHYLVGIRSMKEYNGAAGSGYSGLEIDNCELRGFAWAAIMTYQASNVFVHHNYIHNNEARGEGYGFNLYGGQALLEANIFDYNRHDITGGGYAGEQYEARYNIVLGNGDAIGAAHYDVHQDEKGGSFAGEKYLIHHNTFKYGIGVHGNTVSSIHTRHAATIGTYIDHNLFEAVATVLPGGVPIYQTNSTLRMFATNNKWMGTLYPTNSTIVWFQ